MLRRRVTLTAFLAAGSLLILPAAGRSGSPHRHGAGAIELSLNQGSKWATDDPLRRGMSTIRSAMGGAADEIRNGTLPAARYGQLADTVEAQVTDMIENCRLPPDADAQLHVVLAHILDGAERMRKPEERREGAIEVVGAINAYGRHFEHPGWESLALGRPLIKPRGIGGAPADHPRCPGSRREEKAT